MTIIASCSRPALLVGLAGILAGGLAVALAWRAAIIRARRILRQGRDGR